MGYILRFTFYVLRFTSPLPHRLIKHNRSRYCRVERLYLAQHWYLEGTVAALSHKPPYTLPFRPDDQPERPEQVSLGIEDRLRLGLEGVYPQSCLLQLLDGTGQIVGEADLQVLNSA
jgi:hypothetical protein